MNCVSWQAQARPRLKMILPDYERAAARLNSGTAKAPRKCEGAGKRRGGATPLLQINTDDTSTGGAQVVYSQGCIAVDGAAEPGPAAPVSNQSHHE